MQDHIRNDEVFDELVVVGDPLKEEDQVVYILASLPEYFNMFVTALEANADIPKMDVVRECLLQTKGAEGDSQDQLKALTSQRAVKCY